jgi:hypothetical protein
MDGIGNNTFGTSAPTAPPPPSEVKVRTMQSDLAAMAKSGGGVPRFENVKVEGLSMEKAAIAEMEAGAKGKNNAIIILAAVGVVIVLGVVGYFVYQMFFNGGGSSAAAPQVQSQMPAAQNQNGSGVGANAGAVAGGVSQTSTTPFATHVSFFKKPADGAVTLTLSSGGATASAADLQTFNQKLLAALANTTGTLMEVVAKGSDGKDLSAANVLAQANNEVLDPQFLTAHFTPDMTFFVYRDKAGLWPGYVLSLNPSENWLFLKNDVAKIESSPNIGNFFLTDPGAPARSGFTDSAISGTTVRELPFTNAGTNAADTFVYGWYQGYLLVSASANGFAAAIARL